MNQTIVAEIFRRFYETNSAPTTELIYSSPFELLVSVILSAQATDVSVNAATKPLYKVANTPSKILKLGETTLKEYIKTIGLYKTKAKNIVRTCELLLSDHNGQVPKTRKDLEALPGVGRKTANVILNTAFGEPTLAVDTHIFRVANRTGMAAGKTPRAVEEQLMKLIPNQYKHNAHHWLILHGRYTCQARTPKCSSCVIKDLCEFKEKALIA